ncbi:hypothetical protein E4582_13535 [Luteimonas yindakuii]|uniref:Uncharacterized protein n=1 Tax=Luteimonas yindakuii TaxID=2565782 RepID=A0A4Z1REV1_9GAMM|nr:hypothetical protein E4582_13535 [Luteimonas yindakuii]
MMLLASTLAACAGHRGHVIHEMVPPAGRTPYPLGAQQRLFLMPVPVTAPMPSLVGGRWPRVGTVVCVEFTVTIAGETVDIHTAGPNECGGLAPLASDHHVRLRAAVEDALARWTWRSGAICTFPEGVQPNDACRADGILYEAVPMRLDYRFTFEPGRHVGK